MLNILTIVFWIFTYLLIIISGYHSRSIKRVSMPYVAGVLNFAWEACAVFSSHGYWGHILWLGLDFIIVYFGFRFLTTNKQKFLYAGMLIITTFFIYIVFLLPNGMLISVFAIDLIMAICYIVQAKEISPHFKISIAATKFTGDLFAGLLCFRDSAFVAIATCLIFFCNLFYLCFCLEEKNDTLTKGKKKRI